MVEPIVFHLAVDDERFDPSRTDLVSRAELGLPDDAVVMGIVSRIVPSKGQARILEALHVLGENAADVHLVLIGAPDDPAHLQAMRER